MKTANQRAVFRNRGYNYLLFHPQGYAKKKTWPLILFLHGVSERGSDLEAVTRHGVAKIVKERPDFPFVVVSPQCPMGESWDPAALGDVLREVEETGRIDTERIYLTGLSMGGYGAWAMALKYPEQFAALAPVCGGGDPSLVFRIRHLPVWAFHGAKDLIVPVSESKVMVEALKRYSKDVRLTIYPEAGHDCWTETYNNPELYKWFLNHTRFHDPLTGRP